MGKQRIPHVRTKEGLLIPPIIFPFQAGAYFKVNTTVLDPVDEVFQDVVGRVTELWLVVVDKVGREVSLQFDNPCEPSNRLDLRELKYDVAVSAQFARHNLPENVLDAAHLAVNVRFARFFQFDGFMAGFFRFHGIRTKFYCGGPLEDYEGLGPDNYFRNYTIPSFAAVPGTLYEAIKLLKEKT